MHARSRAEQSIDDILDKLKDQLALEDLEQQRAGTTFSHRMSPAEFLRRAVEAEAAQYVYIFFFIYDRC